MMGKHVDIIAVAALLLGIAVYSQVRQAILWKVMSQKRVLRIERVIVRVPERPAMPVVFK